MSETTVEIDGTIYSKIDGVWMYAVGSGLGVLHGTDYPPHLLDRIATLRTQLESAERDREALQKFAALQDARETEAMGDITTTEPQP